MRSKVLRPGRLSYAEKFSRLKFRLRDPERRRHFALIAIGKAVGVTVALLAIYCVMNYMALWHTLGATGAGRGNAGRGGSDNGAGDARGPDGHYQESDHQPDQHDLDAGRRLPRFRDAGRLHDARSGLLPVAGNRQRTRRMRVRHLSVRLPLLHLGIRLHVWGGQWADWLA